MLKGWIIKGMTGALLVVLLNLFTVLSTLAQTVTFNHTAPPAAQTLNTGSTYNVPAGVTYLMVETWGGGGSGGRRSSNGYGAGGGGGAYSMSIIPVTQSTYRYSIGQGSSSSTTGTPNHGGDTWFNTVNSPTGALVLAQGGRGVANNGTTGAAGGAAANGIGQLRLSGGAGSDPVTSGGNRGGGGGGSSAGILLDGIAASGRTGATAPAGGGNGGNGRYNSENQGNGLGGIAPGGGGGGAYRSSSQNRLGGSGANGQIRITPLQVAQSWVVPAGVTQIKVEAWGGGGRGGSHVSTSGERGGGGGGAYASSTISVTPGQTYYIAVGVGSNNNVNPGLDSWVSLNTNGSSPVVLAKGGYSAENDNTTGANGGDYAMSTGDIRNNGGRGANGVTGTAGGGGGSSAGSTGTGVNATNQFGAVGPSGYDGIGGNGGTANGTPGASGLVPGGGGGGARRTSNGNTNGGDGANGQVIITVLGPQSTITQTGTTQWVAPEGINVVEVEAWGGGGRGGQRSNNGRGGGGGGGAYSRGLIAVTPGQTYYINTGAGSITTAAGESSWFNSSNSAPTSDNFVLAVGGNSAPDNSNNGANGGNLNSGYGNQEKRSGGNGANSTGSSTGGGGASAGRGDNGGNANNGTGGIAPAGGGNGAAGHNSDNTNGNPGLTPGGGGSGARRSDGTRFGGAGADGQVIIRTLDLNVSKSVVGNNTTPLVGSNVTFTITATNNGTGTVSGINVTDVLPSGFTYVSNNGGATYNSGTVTWNVGTLAPSASASLQLTVTVNSTGSYANTATLNINVGGTNVSVGSASITLFPKQPTTNLQLTKEVNNTMSLIGEEVEFKLTVYNAGPQNATGVFVDDILSFGFSHVSNSGGYDDNSGIWTIGTLSVGDSAILKLNAKVNPSGNHYNQATVIGNEFDPVMSNNSSGIQVYPMYPFIEVILPVATTTYDLTSLVVGDPPPGAEVSWHTSSPATFDNKITTPTNVRAGDVYYVAYYDSVQGCYGSTSEVRITRSGLITNPMIRQRVNRE